MNALKLSAFAAAAALAALPVAGSAQDPGLKLSTDPATVPAGAYTLDSNHGRIVWNVSHRGCAVEAREEEECSKEWSLPIGLLPTRLTGGGASRLKSRKGNGTIAGREKVQSWTAASEGVGPGQGA